MRRQPSAISGQASDVRRQASAVSGAAASFLMLMLASFAIPHIAMAQDDQIGIVRGTIVRPVAIEDLDGEPVDLGQVIGRKPVLVEFWASWCTNCAALEPRLRAAYERHGSRVEFLVVAVGVNQTRNSVRRHFAGHALPGRVLWDGNGAAVRAFQTPATSYVVVLDAQGRVAYTGIGPDQDLDAAVARVAR